MPSLVLPKHRPILCFVTNRRLYGGDDRVSQQRLLDAVHAAAAAGVDLIQIREGDLDDRTLLALVHESLERAGGTGALVVVNARADVALAAGAHGVHLRSSSPPAARMRVVAPSLVLGRSVHGVTEAIAVAAAGGCDYLLAGTVFPTPSKPETHPLLGVDRLRDLRALVPLPVLAIGGISVARAAEVARTGVSGIAGIRLFGDPSTVVENVTRVRRSFDTPLEVV